jgi:RND superfamily putative drug exporter
VTTIMPSLMLLVGDRAWWFPSWMERAIPDIGIEGEEYFRERDAEASGSTAGAAPAAEGPGT